MPKPVNGLKYVNAIIRRDRNKVLKHQAARTVEETKEKAPIICPLCQKEVDINLPAGPGGAAYLDGFHHWDCLDTYNGVTRNPDGSRIE